MDIFNVFEFLRPWSRMFLASPPSEVVEIPPIQMSHPQDTRDQNLQVPNGPPRVSPARRRPICEEGDEVCGGVIVGEGEPSKSEKGV